MKAPRLFLWAALILAAPGLTAAEEAPAEPPPPVPADVQLRNGAVLHHVTVLRWEKDRVVLKHAGGADPIRYVDLADSQREAIKARGEYETAHPAAPRPANVAPTGDKAPANAVTYQGAVFLSTVLNRDVKSPYGVAPVTGVYKFGGVLVYAFPLSALGAFDGEHDPVDLPKPLATATTDAEGLFTLSVPAGVPHFIFCQAQRTVPGGNENCAWRVQAKDIKTPATLEFSTRYRVTYRQLRIAE